MKKVVALGMSGGIDSSMALKILKNEWKHIVGANHIVWHGVRCSSYEVISRAEKLCRAEGIPFYCLDVSEEFKTRIAGDFIRSYISGLTPNPCVICNQFIKFTFFYDRLKEQLQKDGILESDDRLYYSTGHYVRLAEKDGGLFLRKAADLSKDQSYMLYRLPRELLSRCIFPLGDILKKDLKAEAERQGLDFGNVRESQDICFIEGSYGDFIAANSDLKIRPGRILDMEGNVLGKHRGYIHYTIGQRKGLGLGSGPWFVTSVIPEKNQVIVGRQDQQGQKDFTVRDLNWFIDYRGEKFDACVKVRYNSHEYPCTVSALDDGRVLVRLHDKTVITRGQSAVFYQDDIVLGGGFIC